MTNTNIQGPINLDGPGLTYKPSGNYGPGEFSKCRNLMLSDGSLRSRNPFMSISGVAGSNPTNYNRGRLFENIMGFLGDTGTHVGIADEKPGVRNHLFINENGGYHAWSQATELPIPAGVGSYNQLVKFFIYNKKAYWIAEAYDVATSTLTWTVISQNTTDPNLFRDTVTYPLTKTIIKTFTGVLVSPYGNSNCPSRYRINTVFIFKDRLWISSNDGLYFSKAVDPTVFATPSGGFVRYADTTYYYAVAFKDNIYIATDSSLYAYSYTSDPNADGYTRQISSYNITSLVICDDRLFGISDFELVEVYNNTLTTMFKLEEVFRKSPYGETQYYTLRASNDLIFINHDPRTSYSSNQMYGPSGDLYVFAPKLNFITKWDMVERTDVVPPTTGPDPITSTVYDTYFLEDKDLIFHAVKRSWDNNVSLYYQYNSHKIDALISDIAVSSYSGLDKHLKPDGSIEYYRIPVELEINEFTPDGSEYAMKKFRNLLVEGQVPQEFFKIDFAFDNKAYSKSISVKNPSPATRGRPPYPYRVGMNQRGHSMSIYFHTDADFELLPVGAADQIQFFALSSLMVYWLYTQRAVGTKNPSGV